MECGGGLLLFAGEHAFYHAQRNWGPLREALPAEVVLKCQHPDATVPEALRRGSARLAKPHPVTSSLGGPLGEVSAVHPLDPKPSAEVLAEVESAPLIVAGSYRIGRVLMVAAAPDGEPSSMFYSSGYRDFLRQAFLWLMGRSRDLVIQRSELNAGPLLVGARREWVLQLEPSVSEKVRATAVTRKADPGWLAAGREPQFGTPRGLPVEVTSEEVRCVFAADEPGLWELQIDLAGEGWANRRYAQLEVTTPLGLRMSFRDGNYVSAPGRQLPLRVQANQPVKSTVRIVDFDGNEVCRKENISIGPLDLTLPHVECGHYEIAAEADGEEARLRFYVTQPLQRIPFSIVGPGCSGTFNEEKVRWFYEYFRSRGFNGFAVGVPTDVAERDSSSISLRALRFVQYLAQRDGFDLWGEYCGAALLQQRTHHGEEGTDVTEPCVRSPQYGQALESILRRKFDAAASLPRMTSLEILDEPHLYRPNVCHCEYCEAEFRRRYGYPMPTWDEAIAARDHRTRNYFEFIIDYATEAFRKGYQIWKSFGPGPKLHHVLCGVGSGHHSADCSASEDLPWSPHADFIEFDCYNYMYPHWRASQVIRWNEFHYLFGHFRFLGLRNKQRVGFFIQVTDRDVPVAPWDPIRAPSETLYAAIGQGAKTFHLMAKSPFTNSQNCREEKFNAFAEDIKKVQRAAPLLDRAERPRSHLAMTFPFHDRLYRFPEKRLPDGFIGLGYYGREQRPFDTTWPYHMAPINVAELLSRAFGEVDVIDQRSFHEGALEDYPAFMLNTTDYITEEDAEAVRQYVERGGVLLCDHVPSHNTNGKPLHTLQALFQGPSEHFYRHVTVTRGTYGEGRTLLFSDDINELYTSSIEKNQPQLRYLLKTTIREFLHSAGIRPHVFSANYEVEVGVLLTDDTVVLVAVNHADGRQQSRLTLFEPPLPVAAAFDLVSMRRFPFRQSDRGIELDVDLDEREGILLGLYPEVPVQSMIDLDRSGAAQGERLAFEVRLTDSAGQPCRGDQIVEVKVTDAAGEERRQFGGLLCAQNGILRIDEPLAINARPGRWTITAFDRYTTKLVSADFTVLPRSAL